jgi:uncharacterized protein
VRVFLDTNVLVSAFTTRGLCADVVKAVLLRHDLVVSVRVLDELERVLVTKIGLPVAVMNGIIEIAGSGEVVGEEASQPVQGISDPDDAIILASAIAAAAEVLVTGDKDLLVVADDVTAIAILSPRQFWERLRQHP